MYNLDSCVTEKDNISDFKFKMCETNRKVRKIPAQRARKYLQPIIEEISLSSITTILPDDGSAETDTVENNKLNIKEINISLFKLFPPFK